MLLISMMVSMVVAETSVANDASIDFAQLAPANSVIVASTDDLSGLLDQLKATPLGGLLELEPIKQAFEDSLESPLAALRGDAEDNGGDLGALMEPTSLGFALFTSLDEETGQLLPFILSAAGYGRNADAAWEALQGALQRGQAEGRLEIDSRDVRGREAMVSIVIDSGEEEEVEFDNELLMMLGDTSTLIPNTDTMYFVRDKSRILVSNDIVALDDALAAIDGDGGDSAADMDDYAAVQGMLGTSDATAVLRFGPLGELLSPILMGPLGMIMPAIDETFGSIEAFGVSLAIAADPSAIGMAEVRGVVYAPGAKTGLMGLLTESEPIDLTPSKAIPFDAISFSRINIAFKNLIPLARNIAASIPMGGQEIDGMLDMYEPMLKPALDTLGPALVQFTTIRRPIAIDSTSNVMMIAAEQTDRVQPLLATIGPAMGLQPRDFNGETVWSDEMQAMAFAVSGNGLLFGDHRGIEQVIRGQGGGGESIGENPAFRAAARRLEDEEVVGWGWTDLVAQFEVQKEIFENFGNVQGGFDEFGPAEGINPAVFDDLSGVMEEISAEDFARYLGPLLWSLTATDEGWTQRLWLLPPTKGAG